MVYTTEYKILKKENFQALTYLRKKKETEKRIEKQLKALDNVQVLVSRIEESKYNSEVKILCLNVNFISFVIFFFFLTGIKILWAWTCSFKINC